MSRDIEKENAEFLDYLLKRSGKSQPKKEVITKKKVVRVKTKEADNIPLPEVLPSDLGIIIDKRKSKSKK